MFLINKVIESMCLILEQWEALVLLLIGISVNQLKSVPEGTTAMGLPVATGAYLYTLVFVSIDDILFFFLESWLVMGLCSFGI